MLVCLADQASTPRWRTRRRRWFSISLGAATRRYCHKHFCPINMDRNSQTNGGAVAEWVRGVRITLRHLIRFGTLAIPFTPLCQCISEGTLKCIGPFYLVFKRSRQSALEMCNLSWTPPLLKSATM